MDNTLQFKNKITAIIGKDYNTNLLTLQEIYVSILKDHAYTNTEQLFPAKLISKDEIGKIQSGILLMDDFSIWNESNGCYTSTTYLKNIIQARRKNNLTLIYTDSNLWSADIRLRMNVDYVILPDLLNNYVRLSMFDGLKYQSVKRLAKKDLLWSGGFEINK